MGIVFPYTRVGSEYLKPYLYGVLRLDDRFTPPLNLLVDTGSDYCVFNSLLVSQLLQTDLTTFGTPTEIQGLDGKKQARIGPIELHIRDLKKTFKIEEAYFCQMDGLAGILGGHGFLDRLSITFSRTKSFEIKLPDPDNRKKAKGDEPEKDEP